MSLVASLLLSTALSINVGPAAAPLKTPLVSDANNRNRSQNSGPIFYVNKPKAGAFKVVLTCKTAKRGQITDGKSPNLVIRVFGPNDKSLAAKTVEGKNGAEKDIAIDLSDGPVGRYRISVVGWFANMAIRTEPASEAIGVAGGDTLGICPNKSFYLYVTDKSVEIKAAANHWPKSKHTLAVQDNASGKVLADQEIPSSRSKFDTIKLNDLTPGSILKVTFTGKNFCKLIVNGTPPVLWSTPEAAAQANGDRVKAGARMVAHHWQKPLALWLQNLKTDDFAFEKKPIPAFDNKEPKYLKYALELGWDNVIPVGLNLMEKNQITDPGDPNIGLFRDSTNKPPRLQHLGYAMTILALYSCEMDGLNPYYQDETIRTRALAALFQCMLMVPEEQLTTFDFVMVKMLGTAAAEIGNDIPEPELKEAFKDGVIEFMSRNAYFDGYQSNQGMNIILGLYKSQKFTQDAVLGAWLDRFLAAMFNDQFVDVNHGQTPEGFYQESGGLDGGYNSYSTQLMLSLWRDSGDETFLNSLKRNFEFLRYICLTRPDGRYVSAKQWNTRTSRFAYGNHSLKTAYDIPAGVTFIRQGRREFPLQEKLVGDLPHKLKATYKEEKLDSRKFWAGYGAIGLKDHSSTYVEPENLVCERPGNFMKQLGPRYFAAKQGGFYAVFFAGDRWWVGDSGSGLASLWHKDFGPLILGDNNVLKKNKKNVLSLSETWSDAKNNTISSQKMHGTIKQKDHDIVLDLQNKKRDGLQRIYRITAAGLSSHATVPEQGWQNHDLYLPLVANEFITLEAIGPDGNAISLSTTKPSNVAAFRWTNKKGEKVELRLQTACHTVLHATNKLHKDAIQVVKIAFGENEGSFTIKEVN
jgi:hypothetical protein